MVIEQIKHQLDRLVPVHRVTDLTLAGNCDRARTGHGQGARASGENRVEALRLADAFRARVIDATTESFVFEITGAHDKIDQFVDADAAARPGRCLAHRRRRDRARPEAM